MKLYKVDVMEDCEIETVLVVAENNEEAIKKAYSMDWSCPMNAWAWEISEVDGYTISLHKVGKRKSK